MVFGKSGFEDPLMADSERRYSGGTKIKKNPEEGGNQMNEKIKIAEGIIAGHSSNAITKDRLGIHMSSLTFFDDKPLEELYGDKSYRVAVYIEKICEVDVVYEDE